MKNFLLLVLLILILLNLIYIGIRPPEAKLNPVLNQVEVITPSSNKPEITPLETQKQALELPYVDQNYLYTKSGKYLLSLITDIEVVTEPTRYVIFTVKYNKYKMTVFTMDWYDFQKIIAYFKGN